MLKGLQRFADAVDYTSGRSPVSLYIQTDKTLNRSQTGRTNVLLVNQNDPVSYGLLHKKQVRPGEVITHDFQWLQDNTREDCCITFYAESDRLNATGVHNGLLVSDEDSTGQWVIAQVPLSKPITANSGTMFIASWPNPLGRTMRICVYELDDDKLKLEVLNISHNTLRKIAVRWSQGVHGLDMNNIDANTWLTGEDVVGDRGRMETPMLMRPGLTDASAQVVNEMTIVALRKR